MTQIALKKDLELFWLNRAMTVRPDLLSGVITAHESPDFLLVAESQRIGVEVTAFVADPHAKPNLEQQVSLQLRALAGAQRLFAARSQLPLDVKVVFTRAPLSDRNAVDTCSRALASYLLEQSVSMTLWERLEWRGDDIDLPPQLGAVFATVVPEPRFAHWMPANAGWVRSATERELARIVAEKATRLTRYRREVSDVRLLIVFDGRPKLGQSVYPPNEPVAFTLSTMFDQVLCLDAMGDRVIPLPTSRPTA